MALELALPPIDRSAAVTAPTGDTLWTGAAQPVRAEIIDTLDGLRRLRPEWNDLFERAGCSHPFSSADWVGIWMEQFAGSVDLFLVAVRTADGRLAALAPLAIDRGGVADLGVRRLRFLGDRFVGSDHLGLLVDPACGDAAVARIADAIERRKRDWDVVDLRDADAQSPFLRTLGDRLARVTLARPRRRVSVCPHIALPARFDRYLESLGAKLRKNLRRAERQLRERGRVDWHEYRSGPGLDTAYNDFVNLHGLRFQARGMTSTFLYDKSQAFHRKVVAAMAQRGMVRLYLLTIDGTPIAGLLGYAIGSRFTFFQSGMNPEWEAFSPGAQMVAHSIERAIAEGRTDYDFLRGDEDYKHRWATGSRETVAMTFCRPTWRGIGWWAGNMLLDTAAAARRVGRREPPRSDMA